MSLWWLYPIIGGFVLSILFTDILRDQAAKWGLVDHPNKDRKIHKKPMPTAGGLAIYSAFAITTLFVLFSSSHFTAGEITSTHFAGLLFGGWILILGGIFDDKFDLPPKYSIIFPILASLIAVFSGIGVEKITNPFGEPFEVGGFVSSVFTFVWLMGMIYTTKLLDGLDGLATGVSSIGALMIAFLALSVVFYQPDVALLSLIAFACLAGFLMWNLHPASIFLGEGGSTFVGFLIGSLAIISGSKIATALLVVGIPVMDVAFVIFNRYRTGKSITKGGDQSHLHHKLLKAGISHRNVVFSYYVIALIFGVTTLIFSSWQKLFALLVLFVIMLVLVRQLSKTDV